jgi:hypothetical protein
MRVRPGDVVKISNSLIRAGARSPLLSPALLLGGDLEDFARGAPFVDDRTLVLARRLEG